MPTILLVDDETAIQHAFKRAMPEKLAAVATAATAAEAMRKWKELDPDVIVLDIHLPDSRGLDTFRALRKNDKRVPIILITGHGTTELAIEAMKEGAFDYLLKPLELTRIRELVARAVRSSQLMRVPAAMAEVEAVPSRSDVLVGRCPAMQEVYKAVGRVARQDISVLIVGESGTGKELVARAIYQHSNRASQPFVAVNCGAIPENLIESELFGHERGAFTGADQRRIGRFEQAAGGTIFLDEVGELPLLSQVKMLRVLQERTFERVGGQQTLTADVRIIAATNADLEAMVADGTLRKDLFFRLNVFTISLPPLRDRGDDLDLLIHHYFQHYRQELGLAVEAIDPEAFAAIRNHPWPGNIRELQSVMKQGLLKAQGHLLMAEDLRLKPGAVRPAAEDAGWESFIDSQIAAASQSLYDESVKRMEQVLLVRVLRHTHGNQLQAAKILGITRGNLRNKIRNLGIMIQREVWPDSDQPDS